MNIDSTVLEAYEKDRHQTGINKILWQGVALLTLFAIADWELFQWLFSILKVKY